MLEKKEEKILRVKDQFEKERYTKVRKIGEGSFGSVIEVFDEETKETRALKKIKFVSEDEGIPVNALREISLLKNMQHQNIVKVYTIYYEYFESKLYILMQFIPENLSEHLRRNYPFSPWAIKSYMHQLTTAITYLHTNLIIHRDIKPQNILVTKDGKLKLCDFGQSKLLDPTKTKRNTFEVGTLWYKAPEVLQKHPYDEAVDVWALGCIFSELANGIPLFHCQSQLGLMSLIFDNNGSSLPSEITVVRNGIQSPQSKFLKQSTVLGKDGNDLLEQMLQSDPCKRISIGKVLKHNYFDGYS